MARAGPTMRAFAGRHTPMKLATYKDGSRDGQLVVVSRDLGTAHYAVGIATRLQQVLDDWNYMSPLLHDLYQTLNGGKARHAFPFEPQRCMAPLPRAFQVVLGGHDPAAGLQRLAGDPQAGAHDDVWLRSPAPQAGLQTRAALAAITGDLPAGIGPDRALDGVRLLGLAQLWRQALPSSPATASAWLPAAYAPVVLTPDELGAAWQGGRLAAQLEQRDASRKGVKRKADLGAGLGLLIAMAAAAQPLRAGAVVLSAYAQPLALPRAEERPDAVEDASAPAGDGQDASSPTSAPPRAPDSPTLLRAGDAARLALSLDDGDEPFGRLDQTVVTPHEA